MDGEYEKSIGGIPNPIPKELVGNGLLVGGKLIMIEEKTTKNGQALRYIFNINVGDQNHNVGYWSTTTLSEESKFGQLVKLIYGGVPEKLNVNTMIKDSENLIFNLNIGIKRFPTVMNIISVSKQSEIPTTQNPTPTTNAFTPPQTLTPTPAPTEPQPIPGGGLQVTTPELCYWCGHNLPPNPALWVKKPIMGTVRNMHPGCYDEAIKSY